MRRLAQPSMACNDWRMREDGITCIQMWNTWEVPQDADPRQILSHVRNVARSAQGGRLRNLVFNCHGGPGRMRIGALSLGYETVNCFKLIEGLVGHIWLVSCAVASVGTPSRRLLRSARTSPLAGAAANAGMTTEQFIGERALNGFAFCRSIAQYSRAQVTASSVDQFGDARPFMPVGTIDRFEGPEITWDASGTIIDYQIHPDAAGAPQ